MRIAFTAILILAAPIRAADPGVEFFEAKVRPVLVENCYQCHSTAAKKQKGGLHLDTRDAIRRGGDAGPAVVPGKPADSLLLKAVRQSGELKMPPKDKLSDAAVAVTAGRVWVVGGSGTGGVLESILELEPVGG